MGHSDNYIPSKVKEIYILHIQQLKILTQFIDEKTTLDKALLLNDAKLTIKHST